MEVTVNDNTYYTKINIASQDEQLYPVLMRTDPDIQFNIITNNQPIELVIDAYTV